MKEGNSVKILLEDHFISDTISGVGIPFLNADRQLHQQTTSLTLGSGAHVNWFV